MQQNNSPKVLDHVYVHPIQDPNAFYCINCSRKLLDRLIGKMFYLKVKCTRCKARFVINKEDHV
jgi:phage FluMu protein Com